MSPRLLRLLLALSLALAVPVQGLAATTAGLCMALGHHDSIVTHSHDGNAAGDHQHTHDESGQPSGAHAYCAPCVACCAAAAISSPAPVVAADQRTDQAVAEAPPFFSGIQPDTLERPPLAG